MSYNTLEFTQEGRLAIIRLNRPKMLNALSAESLKELRAVLEAARGNEEVGSLLLIGNGRGFCAGADLGKVNMDQDPAKRAAQGEDSYRGMVEGFNPIIQIISDMGKPVICAVNGVAAGYGVSLALTCDMVFAAESASFVQVFVPQLGIVPDGGATWSLPRLIGGPRAKGMILTGQKIKAAQAKDWGMIWDCVPDDDLYETAHNMAYRLAHGPTMGISYLKKALNQSDNNTLEQQLTVEADMQRILCATEDFTEGVLAFAEKRRPNFKGS